MSKKTNYDDADTAGSPETKMPDHEQEAENREKDNEGSNTVKLRKEVGLADGIAVIVGSIIGSGIFISPTGVLLKCGSVGTSLLIWLGCGLFSMIGALCYAELGTLIYRSGGDYIYIMSAFGPLVAFLRLWVEVIVIRPGTQTIIALVFAKYTLEPFFVGCNAPAVSAELLAAFCLLTIGFLNGYSVKYASKVQIVFTVAKVVALIIIILTGIVKLAMKGGTENWTDPWTNSNTNAADIAIAFYSGLFAYNGWTYLNCMIEEMKNPRRDLPRAIVISLLICIIVYMLANIAYFTILTPYEMLNSPAVAVSIAMRLYGVMWWIIPVLVALSTFGAVNGTLLTGSRLFYVAGQERQMPEVLSMIHSKLCTPLPSIIINTVLSLIYLCSPEINNLITYTGFANWLVIGLSVLTVLIFRKTKQDEKREIRVPLALPIIYCILTAVLIILAFVGSTRECLMGTIIILTGVPVYFVFIAWKNKPKALIRFSTNMTNRCQKLMLIVPSDKQN